MKNDLGMIILANTKNYFNNKVFMNKKFPKLNKSNRK